MVTASPNTSRPVSESAVALFLSDSNSIVFSTAVTNPAVAPPLDTTAPTVASVVTSGPGIDGSGNGDLRAGDVVTLTVQLSEAVTVTGGTPTLSLSNGGTASYSGGSGTGALTFSYTVGRRARHRRPGGDVVQPQRGNAAGRGD